MPDRAFENELTIAELRERALGYIALAVAAETPDARETFDRHAARYVKLADERKAAEQNK